MSENGIQKFITGLVSGAMLSLLTGVVISCAWKWFLVPALGLPSITVLQAVGVSITVNIFLAPVILITGPTGKSFSEMTQLQRAFVQTLLLLMLWVSAWLWSLVI